MALSWRMKKGPPWVARAGRVPLVQRSGGGRFRCGALQRYEPDTVVVDCDINHQAPFAPAEYREIFGAAPVFNQEFHIAGFVGYYGDAKGADISGVDAAPECGPVVFVVPDCGPEFGSAWFGHGSLELVEKPGFGFFVSEPEIVSVSFEGYVLRYVLRFHR